MNFPLLDIEFFFRKSGLFLVYSYFMKKITTINKGGYDAKRHFQHYFSYIVGSILLVEETGENHRPTVSH